MTVNAQNLIRLVCGLLFGVLASVSFVCADGPAFVSESIYNSNKASVSIVDSNLAADLVILDGGLEQGFRLGMVCLVERGTQSIGELVIIESGSACSAALILDLTENLTIQPGDSVRIKTFQNS